VNTLFHLVNPVCSAVLVSYLCVMKCKIPVAIIIAFAWLVQNGSLYAQEITPPPPSNNKLRQNTQQLKEGVAINDESLIAGAYGLLADEYFTLSKFAKAEAYYQKAQLLYLKLGKQEDASRMARGLAKAQEAQNKITDAITNFENAQRWNTSNTIAGQNQIRLNSNDVNRLQNASNSAAQMPFINSNLFIAQNTGNKPEIANAFQQLGKVNLQQNNLPDAEKNYKNALEQAENLNQTVQYTNQIADAYTANGNFEAAINVQQQLLQREDIQQNMPTQITQFQKLADIYTQTSQDDEALQLLLKSYQLALQENRTIDAKNSLQKISTIYQKQGNLQKSLNLYRQFSAKLDSLLIADESLIDFKILADTEDKIAQLELEKTLKDELILRQTRDNLMLLGASALLLGLFLLIARSWYAIRIKNKKIALQSLRREMNPHFVFNSLNSVNQFIAQNNELAANKYLSAYSNLMRNIMENSNKDFIPLSTELEMLKKYLALEHLRFQDKFDYQIDIAENIDPDIEKVPNMVIQPHLENAIWHGLRYRDDKGILIIRIYKEGKNLVVLIDDNGIGTTQSKSLKTINQRAYESRGLANTTERILLLNQIYRKNISFTLTEKTMPETGTLVLIST
jgi:two-component system, sensor histidine kinase YesM